MDLLEFLSDYLLFCKLFYQKMKLGWIHERNVIDSGKISCHTNKSKIKLTLPK